MLLTKGGGSSCKGKKVAIEDLPAETVGGKAPYSKLNCFEEEEGVHDSGSKCLPLIKRCFESIICGLDVWLSSLAFIFMCFSSLEKPFFFKLDSFSIHPRQIPFYRAFFFQPPQKPRQLLNPSRIFSVLFVFSIESRQILNPSRFLGFFSIASRSIEPNFCALCLLDRSSIHRDLPSAIDRSSIDPLLLRFSARQNLDRYLDPSSCVFYLRLRHDLEFISLILSW